MGKVFVFFSLVLLISVPHYVYGRRNKDSRQLGLSLFNILTFGNTQCTSTAVATGVTGESNRIGTCFTADECSSNGGAAMGGCAMGFGVCCVFTVQNTGSTITQNCTYIQNPGFSMPLTTMGSTLTYTIRKCDPWVCNLRLDFLSFDIAGPVADEVNGGACTDALNFVTTGITSNLPSICGINNGEHVYIEVGPAATDTAVLNFVIAAVADGNRMWDIKVSQILCQQEENPPTGCFQYFMEPSGQITTFNFQDATTPQHLANQRYTICVRPCDGFCCIEYTVCTDPNSFSLNLNKGMGIIDNQCNLDYIAISGASSECDSPFNSNAVSKICGSVLNTVTGTVVPGGNLGNIPVCDCSRPFDIVVNTDGAVDGNAGISRGVCLNYMQIPCRC